MTRLLPPPRTRTGSPAASAARTALMSSSSVVAVTNDFAGPPRPRVVYCDSSIMTLREADHRAGAAEDLLAAGAGGQVDLDLAVAELACDPAADLDGRALVVVGDGDHLG